MNEPKIQPVDYQSILNTLDELSAKAKANVAETNRLLESIKTEIAETDRLLNSFLSLTDTE